MYLWRFVTPQWCRNISDIHCLHEYFALLHPAGECVFVASQWLRYRQDGTVEKNYSTVKTVLQLQGNGTVSGCSQRTFNKNSCDLFTAILYIKILVAYLIISYKNWKLNYNSKRVDDLTIALVHIEIWLEEKLTRTLKKRKTTYK